MFSKHILTNIDTDMLLIITSTIDELFNGVNTDDLEWSWTVKIKG